MLSIQDVYEKFDEIGCCSFATLDGNGGVDSRIAHFFAYDDEGLYLRTMTGKPFFRQMIEGGRLSVCGERTDAPVVWDDENMPHFQPGYMMRVSGSVRLLTDEELAAKAAANPMFAVATYDINKYPETVGPRHGQRLGRALRLRLQHGAPRPQDPARALFLGWRDLRARRFHHHR